MKLKNLFRTLFKKIKIWYLVTFKHKVVYKKPELIAKNIHLFNTCKYICR
jgi:hypothetical protein